MKDYFPLVLIILLTACAPKENNSNKAANTLSDQVISAWEGEIPCADCPGIVYSLNLKKDNSYSEKLVYLEKSVEPFVNNGTWSMSADSIIILTPSAKGSSRQYLLYNGEYVEMLDGDGKKIEAKLNYKLHKKDANENSNSYETINNEIEFKATGNEPFWLVEIDSDKNIHFKQLDGIELTMSLINVDQGNYLNDRRYRAASDMGKISVQLIKKSCTDNMSGTENDYNVKVQIKQKSDKEYQEFSGCGNFLADLKLRPKQDPK